MRVSGFERKQRRRGAATRLRAGLRRHGVIPCPAALRSLLRASDVRFTRGNRVELFREGRSALDAMLAAIEAARHRVHLESYIFRADETGQRFLRALAARARAGRRGEAALRRGGLAGLCRLRRWPSCARREATRWPSIRSAGSGRAGCRGAGITARS